MPSDQHGSCVEPINKQQPSKEFQSGGAFGLPEFPED